MKYVVTTEKSVEQAVADVQEAVKNNKFGVLHIHNIKETLNNKGVPFEHECQVLEVCNPHQAKKVLDDDMSMNMALPCRISVYEEGGQTKIGMIKPKAMLEFLSDSPVLMKIADEVDEITTRIIDQAK